MFAKFARVFYFQRQFDKAADELRHVINLDESYLPAKYLLGLVLSQQRKYASAVSTLESALKIDSDNPVLLSALALAYTRHGNGHAAEITVRELDHVSRTRRVDPFFRAFAIIDKDRDRALDLLQQAYEERFSWLLYIRMDPAFDELRSEPQFASLVSKLNPIPSASAAAQWA